MAGALDIADDLLERLHGLRGNDELVLQKALGTVAAVPLTNEIERLVELRQVLDLVLRRRAHGVIGQAHSGQAELIQRPRREDIRHGHQLRRVELQRILRQLGGQFLELRQGGQRAAGNGGAAQLRLWGNDIEPGGGIGVVVLRTIRVEGNGFFQVIGAIRIRDEVGGLRLGHADGSAQDDAGKAHAADGGPEELTAGVIVAALWGEVEYAAISNQQLDGNYVVAKGTGGVVVLAVDIGADGAADGDLAGARQDRNPQAIGQRGLHELVEGDATIDIDKRGLRVNGVDLVQLLHVDDQAAAILGGVTIGASHAAGDDAAAQVGGLVRVIVRNLCHCVLDDVHVFRGQHMGGRGGGAAPAVQGLFGGM